MKLMKLLVCLVAQYACRNFRVNRFIAIHSALLLMSVLGTPDAIAAGKGGGGGGGSPPPGNPAIVYIANNGDIANGALKVMEADGRNQTLVWSRGRSDYPVWHPNGQQIVFSYDPGEHGQHGIYGINLDGTGLTEIIPAPVHNDYWGYQMCDVSPLPGLHGQYRIAFKRHRNIFVANEDGTGVTPVAPEISISASWSPNGRRLAYQKGGEGIRLLTLGENDNGDIWVEEDVPLLYSTSADPGTPGSVGHVSFAKSANKIYFVATAAGNSQTDLWALHLDDAFNPALLQQLTATPTMDENRVSGSADDAKVTYSFWVDGVSAAIVVASSDGSEPVVMPRPVIDKKGTLEIQRMPAFKR